MGCIFIYYLYIWGIKLEDYKLQTTLYKSRGSLQETSDIQKLCNKIFKDADNKKSKLSELDLTVIANLYVMFSVHQEKKIQEIVFCNDTIH